IAMALVLQGEDGATELLPYLASGEFALQHKAAVAFGLLDRSGRWAVGAILRALEVESQSLIVYNLVHALGRIGGAEAVAALEAMYTSARRSPGADDALVKELEAGLVLARIQG